MGGRERRPHLQIAEVSRGRALGALLAPIVAAAGMTGGCGGWAGAEANDGRTAPLVYGADDRREYFELASPDERTLMSGSMVALVPRTALHESGGRVIIDARTWGEVAGLCADEPFADQPAAAFCSGVLVDWDLVLTAGHCLRVFALQDFVVVFGYAYDSPGHLAMSPGDVATPIEIVSERLDREGDTPLLDYAWVRLAHAVAPSRRPVGIRTAASLAAGDPIVSIGAVGGVPLKWDAGGRVGDARPGTADYFTATTDTFGGSSGGGAFDATLALLGVMSRGADDFADTDEGCARTVRLPDGSDAAEQFTYAARALEGLCSARPEASTLCRPSCGDPCTALAQPPPGAGCSLTGQHIGDVDRRSALLLVVMCFLRRKRGR
jgi:hypothetical protein